MTDRLSTHGSITAIRLRRRQIGIPFVPLAFEDLTAFRVGIVQCRHPRVGAGRAAEVRRFGRADGSMGAARVARGEVGVPVLGNGRRSGSCSGRSRRLRSGGAGRIHWAAVLVHVHGGVVARGHCGRRIRGPHGGRRRLGHLILWLGRLLVGFQQVGQPAQRAVAVVRRCWLEEAFLAAQELRRCHWEAQRRH